MNNARYERKYSTVSLSYANAVCIIKRHPAGFYKSYPDRFVNNIYFDRHDFKSFFDNVDGLSRRSKYRVRWYGSTFGRVIDPVIEIKSKDSQVGYKTIYDLDSFNLERGISISEIKEHSGLTKLPKHVNERMSGYEPIILNGYRRSYFISRDNKFRVTVDTQLHSRTISKYGNCFLGLYKDYDSTIIELKYSIEEADEADKISKYLLVRMTKNSKYVNAVFDNFS